MILWMDDILQHPRNPGMIRFPYQQTLWSPKNPWFLMFFTASTNKGYGFNGFQAYLLKTQLFNFSGNMGYMSVKDKLPHTLEFQGVSKWTLGGEKQKKTTKAQVELPPGRPDYGRQIAHLALPPGNVWGWPGAPKPGGGERGGVFLIFFLRQKYSR